MNSLRLSFRQELKREGVGVCIATGDISDLTEMREFGLSEVEVDEN